MSSWHLTVDQKASWLSIQLYSSIVHGRTKSFDVDVVGMQFIPWPIDDAADQYQKSFCVCSPLCGQLNSDFAFQMFLLQRFHERVTFKKCPSFLYCKWYFILLNTILVQILFQKEIAPLGFFEIRIKANVACQRSSWVRFQRGFSISFSKELEFLGPFLLLTNCWFFPGLCNKDEFRIRLRDFFYVWISFDTKVF